MECFKDCCRNLTRRRLKEQETQVITLKMPPSTAGASGQQLDGARKGLPEDYLLSKLPPDGREVPFVLPTFKASYIQPSGSRFPNLPPGPQSSARCTYAERKAELLGSSPLTYSHESNLHLGHMTDFVSPGSTRRSALQNRNSGLQSPGWSLKPAGAQRLCSSMFDLSSSPGNLQAGILSVCGAPQGFCGLENITRASTDVAMSGNWHLDSSFASSTSSVISSVDSNLDTITLSGDERELGKVCVRVSYQEAVEQVWITVVQCSDVNVCLDGAEPQKIGFKGIITIPKPVQFKSSIKECQQDVSFMETFVFTLRLQQLRCSALVLRLQTHHPRKRTVAECVLSLRQLGAQETEHWLELNPASKSSVCHAELHLTTCFQPVNGRIQLQVLASQNLPASSSPLTHAFFVKVEMQQSGQAVTTKKTRALKASEGQCQWKETFHFLLAALDQDCTLSVKLYSRGSMRRKQCLGQVQLGFGSPVPEAVEQWKDTMAHPEKVVAAWHSLSPA